MPIGETLRSARLARKLTTSEVAVATRMKVQVVDALEREDFSQIPAVIYAKGFIRLYAEHVGVDPHPLIEEYVDRFTPHKMPASPPDREEPAEAPAPDAEGAEEAGSGFWGTMRSAFKGHADTAGTSEQHEVKTEECPPEKPAVPAEKPVPVPAPVEPQHEPAARNHSKSRRSDVDQGPDLFSRLDTVATAQAPIPAPEPAARTEDTAPIGNIVEQTPEEKPSRFQTALVAVRNYCGRMPDLTTGAKNKVHQLKTSCIRLGVAFAGKCTATSGVIKYAFRRFKSRLPGWKSFELSMKSLPVMVVVVIILILLISGITSMVRRKKPVNAAKPAVETQERLRIAVEPPSPYYK